MSLQDDLKNGMVILTRRFSDGSIVKYKTTLNEDLLQMYGLPIRDGKIYDFETMTEINQVILKDIESYEVSTEINYESALDAFVGEGVKLNVF